MQINYTKKLQKKLLLAATPVRWAWKAGSYRCTIEYDRQA